MFYFNKITEYYNHYTKYRIRGGETIIIIKKNRGNKNLNYNIIDDFIYEYFYEYISECKNYKIIIDSTREFYKGFTTTTNYINIIDINDFCNSILGYHQRQNGFEVYNSHIEIINYNYNKFSSRGKFINASKIEYSNNENAIKLIIQ